LGQVCLQHIDGNTVLLAQVCRQGFQSRLVAGNQHQIVATASKALGIGRPDTAGSARDKD
jgi:predicted secreted protein